MYTATMGIAAAAGIALGEKAHVSQCVVVL